MEEQAPRQMKPSLLGWASTHANQLVMTALRANPGVCWGRSATSSLRIRRKAFRRTFIYLLFQASVPGFESVVEPRNKWNKKFTDEAPWLGPKLVCIAFLYHV